MKQAPARARPSGFSRRLWGFIKRHPLRIIITALLVPPAVAASLAALYIFSLVPLTPAIGDIQKAKSEQPSVVLSADGQELAVFKRPNRAWVRLDDISPAVVSALIATEDHRFFEHRGLDLKRIASAALSTFRGDLQGGSTITQQLARNLYPEKIGRAPTIERKIKEAITAVKIEQAYAKNDILETYLNTVPFLYNAYGIEMAARTYFDKPANQLGVLESATLIGMLKGTSYYNPVQNPERALQRRNVVLAQMVRHGKLDAPQFESLKDQPLGLDFERQGEEPGPTPHLTQQLRRWLIAWADRKGHDIHADGLVVHTTVDSRLQAMATQAVTRQADKLQVLADAAWGKRASANKELVQSFVRESPEYRAAVDSGLSEAQALKKLMADTALVQALWRGKTTLQAGFLAIEPANGHVKAWVGSRDFKQDQFDHVQQARRQPGSTFKPFVYGAAFAQDISPWEFFLDEAMEFRVDERTVWKPSDVGQASGLPMTLRDGLIQSKNTITAQLMQRVGPTQVAQVAHAMGVRQSKLDPVPSLALGTSPVTLKEMVSAYGTIANDGAYVEPVLVTRIENRQGQLLEAFRAQAPEQGLPTGSAQTLLDVMRGVIDRGTGAGIRSRFGLKGDLAGKTGTTQDNTDGWFILMHPQLVGGAWVGFNDNRITMGDSWGQGARNALNIVGDFYQQSQKAQMIDAKARFAAPRLREPPDLVERMNDWWFNNMFLGAQPGAPELQHGVAIVEPMPAAPVVMPEGAMATPMPPRFDPPATPQPRRGPQLQWPERQRHADTPWSHERQRAVEAARSPEVPLPPGFSPGPDRSAPVVIRVPDAPAFLEDRRGAGAMGAPPASQPAQPAPEFRPLRRGEGIRILREVTPR